MEEIRKALENHEKLAPKFAELTLHVLFRDIWERAELTKRDRSLITLAALIAMNRTEQLDFHFERGLQNGLKPEELVEMITHLAFYSGWPTADSALKRLSNQIGLLSKNS